MDKIEGLISETSEWLEIVDSIQEINDKLYTTAKYYKQIKTKYLE